MAENNAITKEDLKNALNEVVAHLTGLIKGTAAATEAKLTTEMDRRFGELRSEMNSRFEASDRKREVLRNEMNSRFEASDRKGEKLRSEMIKRFRRADRQRLALRREMENRFYELDGKIMNRFDLAEEHTDQAVAELDVTVLEEEAFPDSAGKN